MFLVNEKVEHIKFGAGVITEHMNNVISVSFQDNEVGKKEFVYPDAFEKFLKAKKSSITSKVLEDLHIKKENIAQKRNEKILEINALKEISVKKKTTTKSTSKKSSQKKS